ncbi:MAG: c-type cytochrome [Terriglobia bacterium]
MTATTATARLRRWGGRGRLPGMVCLLALPLILVTGVWLAARAPGGGGYFVPGDAKAGLKTFFDKGCGRCHAVLGEGGRSAPDLARAPAGHLSAAGLVAAMWNHAPAMWGKMRQEKVTLPAFTESEMANLFAFLYSVRSMDEPGDAERGRELFFEKRCLQCHRVGKQGGRTGPNLRTWASYRNPVSWVQAMWNHAPAMQALMEERGLPWPEFQGNEVADLIAYIRTQATNPRRHVYLEPADPEVGRKLFRQKGCANCHAVRGPAGSGVPDLGRRPLARTLGQFAGSMWNHSPAMWASMQAQHIPRPQFSNKEMADLVAYLFAERYFEPSGSTVRGARVFEVKGCASCHLRSGEGLGPDLSSWRGRVSPIALATVMWSHGPVMLERMQEQQLPWPLFRPGEMVDLMEFLNQGARARRPQARRQ